MNCKHLLSFVFLFLFFSRCSIPEINHTAPQINEVDRGSKFCIILPENHSDGYTWQLLGGHDTRVVEHINEVWHGNEKGIYFNFKALSAGQTTLTLMCRRYTDTSDVKQYVVKISDK